MLSGCSEEKSKPDKEKIAKVYVDLLISEETSFSKEAFQEKRDNILTSYDLTESEYRGALKLYAESTESWDTFFDEAKSYLNSIRDSVKESKSDTTN